MTARADLTVNEASCVTGVPLKQVHRLIDSGLLDGAVSTRARNRTIARSGLVALKFAYDKAGMLSLEGRRRLVGSLLDRPRASRVTEDGLTVDVAPIASAVREGLSVLERARRVVTSDKAVLGGAPCLKGVRVPVHDIAEMVANGDDPETILAAYPVLSRAMIDAAVVYAGAYPRRGRPRRTPGWRASPPKSVEGWIDRKVSRGEGGKAKPSRSNNSSRKP